MWNNNRTQMLGFGILMIAIVLFHTAWSSHLHSPRIIFNGQILVDTNVVTVNNVPQETNSPVGKEEYGDWNINGTRSFSFFRCSVTSAVQVDGHKSTTDSVLNSKVVNTMESFPKALDLNIYDQFITVHSMTIAIVKSNGDLAMKGKIAPIIITKDMWLRSVCRDKNEGNNTDFYLSTKLTSLLTNVEWNQHLDSPTLTALKSISEENGGNLSMSLTFFIPRAFLQDVLKHFRLVYVVGAIGVAYRDEHASLVGSRVLSTEGIMQPDLHLSADNPCLLYQLPGFNHPVRMHKAPFEMYMYNDRRIITVDFSNAIPLNLNGGSRDLGQLYLGIHDNRRNCVELIGNSIPYVETNWLSSGGMIDYVLRDDQHHLLQTESRLVVIRSLATVQNITIFPNQYPHLSSSISLFSCTLETFLLQLLLQETRYDRPENYGIDQVSQLFTQLNSKYSGQDDSNYANFLTVLSLPDTRCNECPIIETDLFFEGLSHSNNAAFYNNDRPLLHQTNCSLENLKTQLQTAIELEFATIPPYLTALFSIKNGFNTEISSKIRSIVIQEMYHMTQAANILIAIGGAPVINSSSSVPSYPTNLPGGVLPNLIVTLEKLSLEYVYSVFMGIEIPYRLETGTKDATIGTFYAEIQNCTKEIGSNLSFSTVNQINHPNVVIVNNASSAIDAIGVIIEQGEGATHDPTQGDKETPAHFFMFEEIVCGKSLQLYADNKYCYNGKGIEFDSSGVWPMQSNPSKEVIKNQEKCQNATKQFSNTYKQLLSQLQEAFNGDGSLLNDAIESMYALSRDAILPMQTPIYDGSSTTCGPVWSISLEDDL